MAQRSEVCLADLLPPQSATIVEVNDDDPALLRYLGDMGLYPKAQIRVTEVAPFEGPVTIRVNDSEYMLSKFVAQQIYVADVSEV